MELILEREYHPMGTNGMLYIKGQPAPLCYTIELPWLQNQPQHSCIPEGSYSIVKRFSEKFKQHLHILDVPGRELILMHPANDAMLELKGCIAPVTLTVGIGKGMLSRKACSRVHIALAAAFANNETILLTIRRQTNTGETKQLV